MPRVALPPPILQPRVHGGFDGASAYNLGVHLSIDIGREDDGRLAAAARELPGMMIYAQTREEPCRRTGASSGRLVLYQNHLSGRPVESNRA